MPYRIIVVDDEIQFLDYIVSILPFEELDLELVLKTTSPKEALKMLRSADVHILLTDVMMNEMSGARLAEIIHEEKPQVNILALSSYDDYDYVRSILLSGAADYLLKHRIDKISLTKALKKIIENINMEHFGQVIPLHAAEEIKTAIIDEDNVRLNSILTTMFASHKEMQSRINLLDALTALLNQMKKSEYFVDMFIIQRHHFSTLLERGDTSAFIKEFISCIQKYALSGYYRSDYSQIVAGALDLIDTNWAMNISLKDAAEILGVNADYLSRQFSKEEGSTFIEYLNKIRVYHAKIMLRDGHTLKEVSYECGFKNYSYFLKVFKKVMKMSPGEYTDKWSMIRIGHQK